MAAGFGSFSGFVSQARGDGRGPYEYQCRVAEEGLPDLLRVPTGTGKTAAVVLGWLWRRIGHPAESVRRCTPRWLVYVLPQRSLVEQTAKVTRGWLENLGLADDIPVHVLMGGMPREDDEGDWRMSAAGTAALIGTQDMVLSRVLLRGYGEPRAAWPVSFGLLAADCHFVFDEVQLMGPGFGTSLQLQGLREMLGTAAPTACTWMSATVDPEALAGPDFPPAGRSLRIVELTEADRRGPLSKRLEARRRIRRLDLPSDASGYPAVLADALLERHVPGERTIAVLNTVARATDVYDALLAAGPEADVVLVHSRFRRDDRTKHMERAVTEEIGLAGQIVVSTQVLEAGIDVEARVMFTEAAPWSSLVQRAGRCNRTGEFPWGLLLWANPPAGKDPAALPYEDNQLAATAKALTGLENTLVTSTTLRDAAALEDQPVYPVPRRADLLELFDTTPDLSGSDIDVSRWIRDADETAVQVAWRQVGDRDLVGEREEPVPDPAELCPAPLGDLRKALAHRNGQHPRRRAWVVDQVDGLWRRAQRADVRPGAVLVLDAAEGGYDPQRGWSPESSTPVSTVGRGAGGPTGLGDDEQTRVSGRWVPLVEHLADVEREVKNLLGEFGDLPGLTADQSEAAVLAGRYHDLGKAHEVFQNTLRRVAAETGQAPGDGPWAKSRAPRDARIGHERRHFRHELVSALALLHPDVDLLDGVAEADLVAYLVAAHHGKVRISLRPMPGENDASPPSVLGVKPDDEFPGGELPDGRLVPPLVLRPDAPGTGADPWIERALRLRDRADLGPFRLGFLEAVVRVADWRASRQYEKEPAR